jgi:hypothetical protein
MLAVRQSAATRAFLESWEESYRASGDRFDQTSLRRLLYESDLRFLALGHEYNVKWLPSLKAWDSMLGLPRVLHVSGLHRKPQGDPKKPLTVAEALGRERAKQMASLLADDWTIDAAARARAAPIIEPGLTARPPKPAPPPSPPPLGPVGLLRRKARTALRLAREALSGR